MNATFDNVQQLLISKPNNNIYSWYINNGTLDEVLLDKIDFISECIHDGLGEECFRKILKKVGNWKNS